MADQKNINEIKPEEKTPGIDIMGIRVPWTVIILILVAAAAYYYYSVPNSIVKITMPEFNATTSSPELIPGLANVLNQ